MKRMLLILMTVNVMAQNAIVKEDNYGYNWELASSFSLEVNTFVPIGDLSKSLKQSVGIGFYFGFPIDRRTRIDLGTSLFFPKTRRNIRYSIGGKTLDGGAMMSGVLGVWGTRVKRVGNQWYWDKKIGLGMGFFQTDIETGKPKEENDSVYGVETFFLSAGTTLRTRLFNSNIGIKFDYFLTPYNLFKKRLPTNFGMQYATVGLIYGFG